MNPYDNYTDTELLTLLTQADPRAFEVIYRRYVKDLYRYTHRRIRSREDSEEIIHDVFESLWKRKDRLLITSLRQYLFASVRYMIIRYFGHRGVGRKFAEHYRLFEAMYDSADEEQQHDPEAIRALLLEHIQELPVRCQEAIRLRITENLSNGEIAHRMSISKRTVELYMFKAFAHLRAYYGKIYRTG